MAAIYRPFNRGITAPAAGWTGDAALSGTAAIEINDGAGTGRGWDMSDYSGGLSTFEIAGTCTTNQGGVLFNLSLYRRDARGQWEFVQTRAGVVSGAGFVFGAIGDSTVFVRIQPVDGVGAPVTITSGNTVTLLLGLDEAQDDSLERYVARLAGAPAAIVGSATIYAIMIGGVAELVALNGAGEAQQLTGGGGGSGTWESLASGALGVTHEIFHNSASPADADVIYRKLIYSNADAGAVPKTEMARLDVVVDDVSDTTEDASWHFSAIVAGTLSERFVISQTLLSTPVNLVAGAAAMGGTERLRVVNSVALVGAFESTDAGAVGATIASYHNSASPADGDVALRWSAYGNNDNTPANKTEMGRIDCLVSDVGDGAGGSEDAVWDLWVQDTGVLARCLRVGGLSGAHAFFNPDQAAAAGASFIHRAFADYVAGQLLAQWQDNAGASPDIFALDGAGALLPKTGTATGAADQAASRLLHLSASMWTGAAEAVRDWVIYVVPSSLAADESGGARAWLAIEFEGNAFLQLQCSGAATGNPIIRSSSADGATAGIEFRVSGDFGAGNPAFAFTDAEGADRLFTIEGDGDGELQSVSAGALGAELRLYQASASPADNDVVGVLGFWGRDDNVAPNKTRYGRVECLATDVSDATEDGQLDLYVTVNAVETLLASVTGTGVNTTGAYFVDGVQVVTNQQAAIADVADGVDVGPDNTLRADVRAIKAMLRVHGLLAL